MNAQPKITCLKGGAVWPGGTSPTTKAAILIQGSRITGIIAEAEIDAAAAHADEVIDTSGMLIMPPLSDAHVHSSAGLFRGTENSFPLELWSYYTINYGRAFTDDAVRHAVLLTNIEMIRNGIGSYIDHFAHTNRASIALDAHRRSGLRVGFAPFFADLRDEDILDMPLDRTVVEQIAPPAPKRASTIKGVFSELTEDLRSDGGDRIALQAGPNSPQRCSDELWALWRDLKESFDLRSHTHLLETLPQAMAARKRWPGGVIKALDAAGLLDDRLSVAHGIWLDADEKALLAARGVSVSYNPISNAMLGSGRKTMRDDLDLGIRIALGTDCANTGGRNDLFEVMRHALVSGREPGSDFDRWLSPEDVLIAATEVGARAVGGEAVTGILAAGHAADLLLLNLQTGGMTASARNLNSVVVHADPRNVHSLMVGGRWLLRDGIIQTLDEAAVVETAARYAEQLRDAAAAVGSQIRTLHEPYKAWQSSWFRQCSCTDCGQPRFSADHCGDQTNHNLKDASP
jgi:5-methylthioadenosine/S-adenosylhomocysteine deaminase